MNPIHGACGAHDASKPGRSEALNRLVDEPQPGNATGAHVPGDHVRCCVRAVVVHDEASPVRLGGRFLAGKRRQR